MHRPRIRRVRRGPPRKRSVLRRAVRAGAGAPLAFGAACAVLAAGAQAASWTFTPSVNARETYTTNVSPGTTGQGSNGSFVTNVGGALAFRGQGARFSLNGTIAANAVYYTGNTRYNTIYPTANVRGNLEAIEDFFFIDAFASVSQTFISPFGPQPGDLAVATVNRSTSQVYGVSPYVQGRIGGTNVSYLVRNDNIWSFPYTSGNPANVNLGNFYNSRWTARLSAPATPLGWTAEYIRNELDYQDQTRNYMLEQARLIVPYQVNPQFQVSARGGYEHNKFPLTDYSGAIYGGGLEWRPTERTLFGGYWEHRFFGSSYQATFSHRRPLSAISVTAYRGINTYPSNAFTIPAGVSVAQSVDAAFTTRIPDPVERAQAVQQFLLATGLPPVLTSPLNFYTQRILLQQGANATLSLIGARNAVAWTVFNVKSESITAGGTPLPPALQFGTDNTQTGTGLTFSHRLTQATSVNATANWWRTESNLQSSVRSTNQGATLTLNTSFSPKTSGSTGLYYYVFDPSIGARSNSLNIFAAVNHTF